MKIRFCAFLITAFLAFGLPTAFASNITSEGAAALKKEIDDALSWRLKAMKYADEGLVTEGETKVTPKDNYYAVSLPRMHMKFRKGEKLDIGVVNINAMPGKAPDEWALSVALPSPIIFYDEKSTAAVTITLNKQRFSALWLPKKDLFSAFDAVYEDIKIEDAQKTFAGMIGSIKTTLDLKAQPDGTWSGPHNFEMRNVAIKSTKEEKAAISLESLVGKAYYDRVDVENSKKLRRTIEEMAVATPPPSKEDVAKLIREHADFFKNIANNISNSMTLTNIDVVGADKTGIPFNFHLGRTSFSLDLIGALQEKGKVTFTTGVSDLKLSVVPAEYVSLLPQDAQLDFTIDNLPMRQMVDAVVMAMTSRADAASAVVDPAKMQQNVAPLALLPQILSDSGTTAEVNSTSVTAPDFSIRLVGKARADALAAYKATADFTLAIRGLDDLITKFNAPPDTASSRESQRLQSLALWLTPLQVLGQIETDANGAKSRKFHFELMPDGKFMLNGADMSTAMALLDSATKSSVPMTTKEPAHTPAPYNPGTPPALPQP